MNFIFDDIPKIVFHLENHNPSLKKNFYGASVRGALTDKVEIDISAVECNSPEHRGTAVKFINRITTDVDDCIGYYKADNELDCGTAPYAPANTILASTTRSDEWGWSDLIDDQRYEPDFMGTMLIGMEQMGLICERMEHASASLAR